MKLAYVDIEARWNIEDPVKGPPHNKEAERRAQNIAEATGIPCEKVNYWDFSIEWMKEHGVEGFVISGNTPDWVEYDWELFKPLQAALTSGDYPVLGVCGGHQFIGMTFGAPAEAMSELQPGEVDLMPEYHPGMRKEKGWLPLQVGEPESTLFEGFKEQGPVVMESHYWELKELPEGFELLASTDFCQIQVIQHEEKPIVGIQGHPEAYTEQYPDGKQFIRNWAVATGLLPE